MNKRWVLGGAALALGLMTIGVWPASAAAPTVTFSAPSGGESVKEAVVVRGDGHPPDNNDSVTRITVRLDNAAGHNVGPQEFVNQPSFNWTPDVPWNGEYTAVAQATGTDVPFDFNGPEAGPPASVTFKVERPPVAPSGVDTSVNEEKRIVTISWNANPEPDIFGYLVYRGQKGIAYVEQGTKFDDALKDLPAGDYKYTVYAAREDGTPGKDSVLVSAPSTKTATVDSSPTVALAGGSTATTAPKSAPKSSGSSASTSRSPSTAGRVNLSGYSNLLPDQSELPVAPSSRAAEADNGFSAELPFVAGSPPSSVVSGEDAAQALNGEPVGASDDSRPESLLFLAAGLLVTVILMHVLWIKSEVDRVPLEPLAPEVAVKP